MESSDLRTQAKQRLEDRRGFRSFAAVFVLVSALLVGIWAISGGGFFWPVFPIAGIGIAVAIQAWNVYGQKPISEDEIQREMDRQRGA